MDWSNKQVGAMSRLSHEYGQYPCTQGCVFTPYGIVAVYWEPADGRNKPYVNLDFIYNGRLFNRVMRKKLTDRGLTTVAHRFAREIAEQQESRNA